MEHRDDELQYNIIRKFYDDHRQYDLYELFINMYMIPLVEKSPPEGTIDLITMIDTHVIPFLYKTVNLVKVDETDRFQFNPRAMKRNKTIYKGKELKVSDFTDDTWCAKESIIVASASKEAIDTDEHPYALFAKVCYVNYVQWCYIVKDVIDRLKAKRPLFLKGKIVNTVEVVACILHEPVFNPLYSLVDKTTKEKRYNPYRFRFNYKAQEHGYDYAVLKATYTTITTKKNIFIDVCKDSRLYKGEDGRLRTDANAPYILSKDIRGKGKPFEITEGTPVRPLMSRDLVMINKEMMRLTYASLFETAKDDTEKYREDAFYTAGATALQVFRQYEEAPMNYTKALFLLESVIGLFVTLIVDHDDIYKLKRFEHITQRYKHGMDAVDFSRFEFDATAPIISEFDLRDIRELCIRLMENRIPIDPEYIKTGYERFQHLFYKVLEDASRMLKSMRRRRKIRTTKSRFVELSQEERRDLEEYLLSILENSPKKSQPGRSVLEQTHQPELLQSQSSQSQSQEEHPLMTRYRSFTQTSSSLGEQTEKMLRRLKSTYQNDLQTAHRKEFIYALNSKILKKRLPVILRDANKKFERYNVVVVDGLNILRSHQTQIRTTSFTDPTFYRIMETSWKRVRARVIERFASNTLFIWVLPGETGDVKLEKTADNEYIMRIPLTKDLERRDDDVAVLATAMFLARKKNILKEAEKSRRALAIQFAKNQQKIRTKTFLDDSTLGIVNHFSNIQRVLTKDDVFGNVDDIIIVSRDKYRDWEVDKEGVVFVTDV